MDEPHEVPDEWVRNKSDELAIAQGCKWDGSRGEHYIHTVENNFRLYEGTNFAGKMMKLMPDQRDFAMRAYSWVRWSDFSGRWVRRFRRTSHWKPKKNGKSPEAAANGNYLTVADGEIGGKTYAVAKDGQQARIVFDHAMKMVEQSPDLFAACKITQNPERRITHLESLSWFGVLSGDNIEGQEGRNGNAIVDEAHVVNERLARVLKYMGASREEPLEMAFSTAGDNIDGWGKKRWDYGERVNAGEIQDTEFLHVCYAAPQDASDEELRDRDLWRRVNPAMGFILDEERFAQELEAAASGSLLEWSDFKKYRFNIWQHSSSPWLSLSGWAKGAKSAELDPDADTWIGIDLSAVSDFTAIAVLQRDGDGFRVQVRSFVSQTRANQHANNGLPVFDWARDGHLTICEGSRIDYELVYAALEHIHRNYRVVGAGYDKAMAEALRQHFEPLGLPLVEIPQNFTGLNAASKTLEALVSDGLILHGGDPLLGWMAKNVTVKRDDSDRIRPVKPDRKELKAIDGIVALIMAIGEAEAGSGGETLDYYESNALEIG